MRKTKMVMACKLHFCRWVRSCGVGLIPPSILIMWTHAALSCWQTNKLCTKHAHNFSRTQSDGVRTHSKWMEQCLRAERTLVARCKSTRSRRRQPLPRNVSATFPLRYHVAHNSFLRLSPSSASLKPQISPAIHRSGQNQQCRNYTTTTTTTPTIARTPEITVVV